MVKEKRMQIKRGTVRLQSWQKCIVGKGYLSSLDVLGSVEENLEQDAREA